MKNCPAMLIATTANIPVLRFCILNIKNASWIKIFREGPDKNLSIKSFSFTIATKTFHTTMIASMTMCDGHLRRPRSIN